MYPQDKIFINPHNPHVNIAVTQALSAFYQMLPQEHYEHMFPKDKPDFSYNQWVLEGVVSWVVHNTAMMRGNEYGTRFTHPECPSGVAGSFGLGCMLAGVEPNIKPCTYTWLLSAVDQVPFAPQDRYPDALSTPLFRYIRDAILAPLAEQELGSDVKDEPVSYASSDTFYPKGLETYESELRNHGPLGGYRSRGGVAIYPGAPRYQHLAGEESRDTFGAKGEPNLNPEEPQP